MGWRFRKSFTIIPGLRVNVGSRGVTGLSIGGQAGRLNLSRRGVAGSVSVPGTGLSYTQRLVAPSFTRRHVAPASVHAHGRPVSPQISGAPKQLGLSRSSSLVIAGVALTLLFVLRNWSDPESHGAPPMGGGNTVLTPAPRAHSPPVVRPLAVPLTVEQAAASSLVGTREAAEVAREAKPVVWATTAQRVNVRSSPSISGAVLRTVAPGTQVRVVQIEGNWKRVIYPDDAAPTGWIHQSLLIQGD